MFVHRVKLVPVRHRRLSTFFVPAPVATVSHAEPEEWNLETYRLMPVGTKILRGTGFGTGSDRLAIKSERDGLPRMLPEAISALWQRGEVPIEALPPLLATFGPELTKPRDFEPVLSRSKGWQLLPWIALFLVLTLVPLAVFLFYRIPAKPPGTMYEITTLERWRAGPMRPGILVSTSGPLPALASVTLPAAYRPPAENFSDPVSGNPQEMPVYALARVQAENEQRLVLVSGYEHGLLPEVYPSGIALPTDQLALPAASLAAVSAGARDLNPSLTLCNHVMPKVRGMGLNGTTLAIIGVMLASGLAFVALLVGILGGVHLLRRAARHRQLRGLRRRLGLPENPPAAAVAAR